MNQRTPSAQQQSFSTQSAITGSQLIDRSLVRAFFLDKHLGFMRKRLAGFSSSSGHNIPPIVIRSRFLAYVFGLTGKSKRNLINVLE
jgi:hypothetical protein